VGDWMLEIDFADVFILNIQQTLGQTSERERECI
jgi:hypothetical protein